MEEMASKVPFYYEDIFFFLKQLIAFFLPAEGDVALDMHFLQSCVKHSAHHLLWLFPFPFYICLVFFYACL